MWDTVEGIRTSTTLVSFFGLALLAAACAKGTEIDQSQIVILPVLPDEEPDASVDAGARAAASVPPEAPPATQ